MRLRTQLVAILLHIAATALLWWLPWIPFALAFGWVFAWTAIQEPRPTRNPRQGDVAAFEKTKLGRALKYRAGWLPPRFPHWGGPVLTLLLFGPGVALAFSSGEPFTTLWWRYFIAWTLTSPVMVLGLGAVVSDILIQPLIMPFFVLAYVVGVVAAAGQGIATFFLALGAALPPILLLLATDLSRLLRRSVEVREPSPDVSPFEAR